MKLKFWRGETPNFGDDLNVWLWDRVLPDFFDDNDDVLFIGMGSILYHDYPAAATKIVFGSGYGGYTEPPVINDTWKIYFVRGPRTAEILKIDRNLGIGDPASLVGALPEVVSLPRATAGAAFMPHWESTINGSWQRVAESARIRYIDPRWAVERIITEIASSTVLVTEAMHGAIVADSLRVPWIPLSPIGRHRFKWYDWADSLEVELKFARSAPSTGLEALLRCFNADQKMQKRLIFYARKHKLTLPHRAFTAWATHALNKALQAPTHMSTDAAISNTWKSLYVSLASVRRDFGQHVHVLSLDEKNADNGLRTE